MELSELIPSEGIALYVSVFIFCMLIIQLFYYLFYYGYFLRFLKKPVGNRTYFPPASIIICAKNESKNLKNHLPQILAQEYPSNFEVIVVNDASEDDSELVLARFKEKNKHLYYTSIPYDKKFRHGKKLAVTIGVKAANNEHLLFTDADCLPAGKHWLKNMMQGFEGDKEIVLGYGPYRKEKGFINKLQRFDTFYIAMLYLSLALRGRPYMGVGRNLAYKKSLFQKHNGFQKHQHILSGDDDLFIRDAATKKNVGIVALPEAFTYSEPVTSFKEWRRQKSRHLTTAPHYKFSIRLILGLEALSRQLFWTLSLICVFFPTFVYVVLAFIFIKLLVQIIVQNSIAKRLHSKDLIGVGVLFDIILPFIIGLLLIGGKRQAKKNKWT